VFWARLASVVLFLGVALGAFGAHGLRGRVLPEMLEVWKTAGLYHLVHGGALFAVAWLSTQTPDPKVKTAGILFVAGIAVFSGSLYLLALTGARWLGALTPLGGLAFLAGWAFLAAASSRNV